VWDSQVPRAPKIPKNIPPKIEVVYGPTRFSEEMKLPEEYGTNWGNDPRKGKSRVELYPERYNIPPPTYTDILKP
jgi:hypothetical protein